MKVFGFWVLDCGPSAFWSSMGGHFQHVDFPGDFTRAAEDRVPEDLS